MENLISTLRSKKTGYGRFKISIDFEGKEIYAVTTNTLAIDAAFDDDYDLDTDGGKYYDNQREAQEALVNEILRANDIE